MESFQNGHAKNILRSLHSAIDPVIKIDGDTAHGTWSAIIPLTVKDIGKIWCFGRYEEDYVKVNGKWLIKRLVTRDDAFVAPYEIGW